MNFRLHCKLIIATIVSFLALSLAFVNAQDLSVMPSEGNVLGFAKARDDSGDPITGEWILINWTKQEFVVDYIETPSSILWEGPPGKYGVMFKSDTGKRISKNVELGEVKPNPPNPPDPPNPPNPPNPPDPPEPNVNPIIAPVWGIIIRESSTLTAEQNKVLRELRFWTDSLAAEGKSGPRIMMISQDEEDESGNQNEKVKKILSKIPKDIKLPYIIIAGESSVAGEGFTIVDQGELPMDVNSVKELLLQYEK